MLSALFIILAFFSIQGFAYLLPPVARLARFAPLRAEQFDASKAFDKLKKAATEAVDKAKELNEEHHLLDKGKAALKTAGELSVKAVEKAKELNEEVG